MYPPSEMNSILLPKPGVKMIRFTGGSYDVPSLPTAEVKRIFEEASPQAWAEMLQYGGTAGMPSLLKELSNIHGGPQDQGRPRQGDHSHHGQPGGNRPRQQGLHRQGGQHTHRRPHLPAGALLPSGPQYPKFVDIPIDARRHGHAGARGEAEEAQGAGQEGEAPLHNTQLPEPRQQPHDDGAPQGGAGARRGARLHNLRGQPLRLHQLRGPHADAPRGDGQVGPRHVHEHVQQDGQPRA